jgi:hypothetical protein
MFVVGTVQREGEPDASGKFATSYPVVAEDAEQGYVGSPVASRPTREAAQKLADDLNAVLAS